jgi:hypothetical protein
MNIAASGQFRHQDAGVVADRCGGGVLIRPAVAIERRDMHPGFVRERAAPDIGRASG